MTLESSCAPSGWRSTVVSNQYGERPCENGTRSGWKSTPWQPSQPGAGSARVMNIAGLDSVRTDSPDFAMVYSALVLLFRW